MLVFSFFIIITLAFITLIILSLVIQKDRRDGIFKVELQLLYHDIYINKNLNKITNIKDIYSMRKKSKYRKIGYGGHPVEYLFSFPLDSKILLSPVYNNNIIELLVFIHCRPEEFYERLLYRKCSYKSKQVKVIYITSKSSSNKINNKLRYESEIYKDILQFNEISSYFNLSIQTVHMIIWSINIKFKYLLKTDIDVLINIPLILRYIMVYNSTYQYYAMGRKSKAFVIRNKKYSHYIPYEIIKENLYPPYLQGVGYIIPYNTVILLQESIKKVKPRIWIEDVFMGYMFKYTNVSLIDLSNYILRDLPDNLSYVWNNVNKYMLIHGLYPIEIYILKERYLQQ